MQVSFYQVERFGPNGTKIDSEPVGWWDTFIEADKFAQAHCPVGGKSYILEVQFEYSDTELVSVVQDETHKEAAELSTRSTEGNPCSGADYHNPNCGGECS